MGKTIRNLPHYLREDGQSMRTRQDGQFKTDISAAFRNGRYDAWSPWCGKDTKARVKRAVVHLRRRHENRELEALLTEAIEPQLL